MAENDFRISRVNGTIIVEKENYRFGIWQAADDDIWFTTSKDEVSLEISYYSRVYSERQTYLIFEKLMKTIVGRYMLSGDNKDKNSSLPKDFVDLESNSIVWHSDSSIDNVLKLCYNERTIIISISKSKDASTYDTNAVRIRTSGSSYEYYYQEFLDFFRFLSKLELMLNKPVQSIEENTEQAPAQRKISLFRKHKK